MSLLAKRIRNLESDDRKSLKTPFGTRRFPYLGLCEAFESGIATTTIGIRANDKRPNCIVSIRPRKQVVALSHCNMPVPSALEAESEILEQMDFDNNTSSLFSLLIGTQGWGKTQLAENVGLLMGGEPAILYNCSHRDLDELLWTTTIDFGENFKSVIQKKVRNGSLLESNLKILEDELPEALVKDEEGQVIDIEWKKTVVPRSIAEKDDKRTETSREAASRSIEVFKDIARNEGIPVHGNNALGFKKEPGPIKEAWDTGCILIADEFTKGKNAEPLLEFLNWAGGMGPDTCVVRNNRRVSGEEDNESYVLRRSERKVGFGVIATGNLSDPLYNYGDLSPIFSRIDKFEILSPTKEDWEHRIGQILTGAPISMLVSMYGYYANKNPEEFANIMMERRNIKGEVEGIETPLVHFTRLKNWQQTIKAVDSYAKAFHFVERLFDLNSDLYTLSGDNAGAYEEVRNEIDDSFTRTHPIDPRLFIRLVKKAERAREETQKIDMVMELDPRDADYHEEDEIAALNNDVLQYQAEFGKYLQKEIEKWVVRITRDKPKLNETIQKEFRERGVAFTPSSHTNTAANHLNQDVFANAGGLKTITNLRAVISRRIRENSPEHRGKSDEEIISMDHAASLVDEITRMSKNAKDKGENAYLGRLISLGSSIETAFKPARAIDGLKLRLDDKNPPQPKQLVVTKDFIESLSIPALEEINMSAIWRRTLSNDNVMPADKENAVHLAENSHKSGIGITSVMTQDGIGNSVVTHVMTDKTRQENLIVTDKVNPEGETANGYTFVTYDDPNASKKVFNFILESSKNWRMQHSIWTQEDSAQLNRDLIAAFNLRVALVKPSENGEEQELVEMAIEDYMTSRDVNSLNPVYLIPGL